jgi:hypothetical protein
MPDTSTLNALADDPGRDALIPGLTSGYRIRLPFTAVSEVIATTSGARRKELLKICRRLLLSGDCVAPHQEIIRVTVAQFEQLGRLDHTRLPLRVEEAEKEITSDEVFDEDLAMEEREHGRTHNKTFVSMYAEAKRAFDKLAAEGVSMPGSVAELVIQLQQGGAFWTIARDLYDRVAKNPSDDAIIREFYAACPPFRAILIAIVTAQYDRCIRAPNAGPSLKAGRNDTFMAACLPYCDVFVTNDDGQLVCYRQVVSIAEIRVNVLSYHEFQSGLLVMPTPSTHR